ncbi:MAG: type II toxin-antitoxin system RelE/ParE family toxin [Treponema sp.]|nr:type II toxin-antitoxin system RelE/ParE family toxin [Treponema sp.]
MYEIDKTEIFTDWLHNLTDIRAKARIRARIERASKGNFGNWSPEGGEIRALVIDYGPGYRVYYTIRRKKIIFLICGGNKSTQQADIKQAHKLAKELI